MVIVQCYTHCHLNSDSSAVNIQWAVTPPSRKFKIVSRSDFYAHTPSLIKDFCQQKCQMGIGTNILCVPLQHWYKSQNGKFDRCSNDNCRGTKLREWSIMHSELTRIPFWDIEHFTHISFMTACKELLLSCQSFCLFVFCPPDPPLETCL